MVEVYPSVWLQLVFLILLLVYVIYSVILVFHWKNYGLNLTVTSLTLTLYFAITVPLFLTMAAILYFYVV